jgi:hypothetical protein
MSRSKPVSLKEAYDLGYYDSEHGFPDGADYDINLPKWEAKYGNAYADGFYQRDKELRTKTMKKNPIGTAEELIARAYKEGLVDGKNHASKDSYYTKEAPRELKLSYLEGYSKGKRENPMKKNSTVRINPKHRYSVDEVASGKGWYAIKDLDGYSLNYNGPNGWEYDYRTYPTLEDIYKEWGYPMKKNSTVRINPQRLRDSRKPKRAAYSDFDVGYYDARTGGPGGKLDDTDEYNSGFSEGLKEFDSINSPKNNPLVKRKNTHLQFEENPKSKKQLPFRRFFPKIKPGRPAGGPKGGYWWILDLYDSKDRKLGHLVGKGTKEKATLDAKYKVGDKYKGKEIIRAMLSGPYDRKPTSKTKRK